MKLQQVWTHASDSPEEFYTDFFHIYRLHTAETCRELYNWVESQASTRAQTTYLDENKKHEKNKIFALR